MITQVPTRLSERYDLLPPFDPTRLKRFEAYVELYRSEFQRMDQLTRFKAYLRGLLEPIERKNVESIAAVVGDIRRSDSNLSQALQHFVSHSPWESRNLMGKIRELNRDHRRDPEAVYVVHDIAFSKKGQHSVGVMRQLARSFGKKINCQVGVFVAQMGPKGYFPLATRLYLPANWLKEHADEVTKIIPEEFRAFSSKGQIALSLVEELLRSSEVPRPIVLESGYLADNDLIQGLRERQQKLEVAPHHLEAAIRHAGWLNDVLGLDHFEGRTWHGWHHHLALVLAAYNYLASERLGPDLPPFVA